MKGLTSKIMFSIGGTLLILLLITGTVIIGYNSSSFNEKQLLILENTDDLIAEKVGRYFERYITIVETMATDQNVRNFMETAHKGDSDTIEQNTYFEDVYQMLAASQKLEADSIQTTYVADVDANVLFDSDLWISGREGEPYDVTTREWYKSVSGKRLFISEPYEDVNTKNMVVTISTPVYSGNGTDVLGITAVDIEINQLTSMVREQVLGETGYIMLCSPENVILSHKDSAKVLKGIKEAGLSDNIVSAVENGNAGIMEYTQDGIKMIGNCVMIGDTNWKIVSAMPRREFQADVTRNIFVIVGIYACCMVLMLTALFLIARIVVNPLKRLTQVTDELAAGRLDTQINVDSGDEVGRLATSLGSLIARLKEYIVYIDEISKALDKFAGGSLTVELKQSYNGEFARLKDSMLKMSESYRDVMRQISEAAQEVNSGAEQMADGAQLLASSATQQASSVEEMTDAVNRISDKVSDNAANARQASSQAAAVGTKIDNSNQKMHNMIAAIKEISDYSRNIGEIIGTIEDIAEQTNLLALNASVEAARAGESGRGFAVIAGNVQELASKSAQAASNTTSMIENTVRSVERGTRIAEDTAQAMAEVVSGAKGVVDTVQNISQAMEEEAEDIRQVQASVEQMAAGIETNSATAQESAASSEELSAQANLLQGLVGRFN